jgi:tRNA-splicing ligase RtcB
MSEIIDSKYKNDIKPISQHKQEFKTEKMGIPAILHASENLLPNDETFSELENIGSDGRVFQHIAGMSDIHSKKGRKNPTGSVIVTENFFFPQVNDTAPNCGMRLIKTGLTDKDISEKQIDEIFTKLTEEIPTKSYIGTTIPYHVALDICRLGIAPLLQHLGSRTKNEIENTFSKGNFFGDEEISRRDILDAVPKLFIKTGMFRLGILGAAGNHFLDLMKITEIKDRQLAEKFGISEGQYVFLLHTGSGLLGQYASYMYTPKVKEHLSQRIMLKLGTLFFDSQLKKIYRKIATKVRDYKFKQEFLGYEKDSMESNMFWRAHCAAANFGFANRSMITHNIDQALESVLGKQVPLELLYDTTHISITKENHFGKDLIVHRNGSVRAYGPQKMKDHGIFATTGEPVFIPSSMATPAYIGAGTDNNTSTYFSAPHGTGRRKNPQNDTPENKAALFSKMEKSSVKLYNAKSKGVLLQDSAYYKDVEEVIEGLETNEIIKVAAKMQPVAVLMY